MNEPEFDSVDFVSCEIPARATRLLIARVFREFQPIQIDFPRWPSTFVALDSFRVGHYEQPDSITPVYDIVSPGIDVILTLRNLMDRPIVVEGVKLLGRYKS